MLRVAFITLALTGLVSCASAPPMPAAQDLLHDEWFQSVPLPPAGAALAMSEPMREFVRTRLRKFPGHVEQEDPRRTLFQALYKKNELQLEYESERTRTASEAFEARSGNCLSLVLLTSAMAQAMGLQVQYQMLDGSEAWAHEGKFFLAIGHVNIVLDQPAQDIDLKHWTSSPLVVDFLPSPEAAKLNTYVIEEKTVVAAYLNNRAVETLVQGHLDEAYAWTRASLGQDKAFANAYVTLGVVYRLSHHPEAAEQVLERLAARMPDNLTVMSNQVLVLKDLHRDEEAKALQQRVAQLDPHPAGSYYRLGVAEFKAGHFEQARRWYEREIARDPDHAEFEFALAVCLLQLHERDRALTHLRLAMNLSTSAGERQLYAAKLARLQRVAAPAP